MRSLLTACVGASLVLAVGCSVSKESEHVGQLPVQPSADRELLLPLCERKDSWFFDQNGDSEFSVGDRLTYVVSIGEVDQSGGANCTISIGSFYGSEEIVEKRPAVDGKTQYLTTFQGTAMLPDGNLRLMAMGVVHFSRTERLQLSKTSKPPFRIEALFPEKHPASVQGQGGAFAGLIGTAIVQPGQPPEIKVKLSSQMKMNR